jgi:uncharacterized membrane protein YhaH (DUF805 family)
MPPRFFILAVGGLYLLGLAAQLLTVPAVLAHADLWPFLLAQAVLTGAWYVVHARRLHDAGRGSAAAQGVAMIHVLAVVLLVLIGAFYTDDAMGEGKVPESLRLVRALVTFSHGAGDLVTVLGVLACAALLIPPVFSLWLALQPGAMHEPP